MIKEYYNRMPNRGTKIKIVGLHLSFNCQDKSSTIEIRSTVRVLLHNPVKFSNICYSLSGDTSFIG